MTTRRLTAILAALTLLAASCGGTDDAGDGAAAPAETSTTVTTTTTTTSAPPPTTTTAAPTTTTTIATTTTTTTIVPFDDLPRLDDALGETSGDGSLVVAGAYGSETLSVRVRYGLATEVSVDIREQNLSFGPPGFGYRTHPTLTIAEFAGLPRPEDVNVHEHPENPPFVNITSNDDLTAFFTDTPGLVLLDSGVDGNAAWWDFTADPTEGGGYECPFGDNCFNIVTIADVGYFIMGEDWTARIWRFESDAGPVYAWLQALNDDFPTGLDFGQSIVDAITVG